MNQPNEAVKKPSFLFTTSWDDGHILDLRVAEMLARFDMRGTFYVNQYRGDTDSLAPNRIQELSQRFEIGAHTLTHPDLTKLGDQTLKEEIEGSKKYLENLLGKEIQMFCYPKGLYSERVIRAVKDAGFIGARTTKPYTFILPNEPFLMGVTMHAYPWPLRKKSAGHLLWGRHLFQPIQKDVSAFLKTAPPPRALFSWQAYARHLLDYAMAHGNYFHLWGHSWEIEKYDLWGELEAFFRYASQRIGNGAFVVTNSDVIKAHTV